MLEFDYLTMIRSAILPLLVLEMLAMLLFLAQLNISAKAFYPPAYLLSVGGLLYPFVWLFAGIYGPEMGRTEAKEAFAIFGYMGGLFLVVALWTLILSLRAEPK